MRKKIVLGAILGLALLLRILLIIDFPITELEEGDAYNFDSIAVNLIHGKGILEPWAERPPLYAFTLSAIYYVFGHSYFVAQIFQAILGTLTCIIVYLLARDIFGYKVALISAIITVIYPIFIVASVSLLAEPLFTFLLCLTIYVLNKATCEKSISKMSIAGVLMGLTTLTKPLPLFYVFFLIIVLILIYREWKKSIIQWAVFTLSMFAIIAPWTYRNYLVFNTFLPVSTNGGFNMWAGSYPPWGGKYLGGDAEPLKSYLEEAYKNNLNYVQIDKMFYAKALENITSHPFTYLKLCIRKLFFLFPNTSNDSFGLKSFYSYRYHQPQFWFLLLMYLISIALPALTVLSFAVEPLQWKRRIVTFSIILYTSCLLLASVPGPRYILPVMPFMIIFSVYAILNFKLFFKHCQTKGFHQ